MKNYKRICSLLILLVMFIQILTPAFNQNTVWAADTEETSVVQEPAQTVAEEPVTAEQEPVQTASEESVTAEQEPVQTVSEEAVTVEQEPVQTALEEPVTTEQEPVHPVAEEPATAEQEPAQTVAEEAVTAEQEPAQIAVEEPVTAEQEPADNISVENRVIEETVNKPETEQTQEQKAEPEINQEIKESKEIFEDEFGQYMVSSIPATLANALKVEKFVITLAYQFNDVGNTVAAKSDTKIANRNEEVVFDLPKVEITNLKPYVVARGEETQESKQAATNMNDEFIKEITNQTESTLHFKIANTEVEWKRFIELSEAAGFLQKIDGKFVTDPSGAIRIQIPVVYEVNGDINFTVKYMIESLDKPGQYEPYKIEEQDVEEKLTLHNTAVARLDQMVDSTGNPVIKDIEGFSLSEESNYLAQFMLIEKKGKVVELKYNRNSYNVYFEMDGGNPIDPIALRYEEKIQVKLPNNNSDPAPTKMGASFTEWKLNKATPPSEPIILDAETTMPAEDIIAKAVWVDGKTNVKLTFFIQDIVNGKASETVYSNVGSIVYGNQEPNSQYVIEPLKAIDTPEELKDLEAHGIKDLQFFELNEVKTNEANKNDYTIARDGSTVINLYYDRQEFTVRFFLGAKGVTTGIVDTTEDNFIATSITTMRSDGNVYDGAGSDWYRLDYWPTYHSKNYKLFVPNEKYQVNGKSVYTLDEAFRPGNKQEGENYEIKAKYGEDISDRWPRRNLEAANKDQTDLGYTKLPYLTEPKDGGLYRRQLMSWNTFEGAYDSSGKAKAVKSYMDVEMVLDKDLVVKDNNDIPVKEGNINKPRRLLSVWRKEWNSDGVIYNIFYKTKDVPGTAETETLKKHITWTSGKTHFPESAHNLQTEEYYKQVNRFSFDTNDDLLKQVPPGINGMNCVDKYYINSGGKREVFFFYEYNKHTVSLNYGDNIIQKVQYDFMPEVNPNPAVDFLLKNKVKASETVSGEKPYMRFPNATAEVNKYISEMMQANWFDGWYYDPEFQRPVRWDAVDGHPADMAIEEDFTLYAKWKPMPGKVTFVVPDGEISAEQLKKLRDEKYQVFTDKFTDGSGISYMVYEVTGIPRGELKNVPVLSSVIKGTGVSNNDNLKFSHWEKKDGSRYIYNDSNVLGERLALTAKWSTKEYAEYTVKYLTVTSPESGGDYGYDTEFLTDENGVTQVYYRLAPNVVKTEKKGSIVREASRSIPNHENFMVDKVEKSTVVRGDGNSQIIFYYEPFVGEISYVVHYVDANTYSDKDFDINGYPIILSKKDYGNQAPPPDCKRLWKDKKRTVNIQNASDSVAVHEEYESVPGYTIMGQHKKDLVLSKNIDDNHIYFYYRQNSIACKYTIKVHFPEGEGKQPLVYDEGGPENQVITSEQIAASPQTYIKDPVRLEDYKKQTIGYEYDETQQISRITLKTGMNQVIDVYLKKAHVKVSYDLKDPDKKHPDWLVPPKIGTTDMSVDSDTGYLYEGVEYGSEAKIPSAPSHKTFKFKGWEYNGIIYSAPKKDGSPSIEGTTSMIELPFYRKDPGVRENVVLRAKWESYAIVFYDTRGGTWTDTDTIFNKYESDGETTIMAYVSADMKAPEPQSPPTYVGSEGIKHNFIGWTAINPKNDSKYIMGENHRVDIDLFKEKYAFKFEEKLTPEDSPLKLYAVWDPPVFTFTVQKLDLNGNYIPGVNFRLERIQTKLENETVVPVKNAEGKYEIDTSFNVRTFPTNVQGKLTFRYLTVGYYMLTEQDHSDYKPGVGANPIVIKCLQNESNITLIEPENSEFVYVPQNESWTLVVKNIPQYKVVLEAPESLDYTYTAPKMIWDPVNLKYVQKQGTTSQNIGWTMAENAHVTVSNQSIALGTLTVDAVFETTYNSLLQKSKFVTELVENAEEVALTNTEGVKSQWKLKERGGKVKFRLDLEGEMPNSPGDTASGNKVNIGKIKIQVHAPKDETTGVTPPVQVNSTTVVQGTQ